MRSGDEGSCRSTELTAAMRLSSEVTVVTYAALAVATEAYPTPLMWFSLQAKSSCGIPRLAAILPLRRYRLGYASAGYRQRKDTGQGPGETQRRSGRIRGASQRDLRAPRGRGADASRAGTGEPTDGGRVPRGRAVLRREGGGRGGPGGLGGRATLLQELALQPAAPRPRQPLTNAQLLLIILLARCSGTLRWARRAGGAPCAVSG